MTGSTGDTGREISSSDAEAIRLMRSAVAAGRHWFIALLEAIGRWGSASEVVSGRVLKYLLAGEAFDWLLLAERIIGEVGDVVSPAEKNALVNSGRVPLNLNAAEVEGLIGVSKYRQYLNYFYGVIVEGALFKAVREEVRKERWYMGNNRDAELTDEAYRRIYNQDGDTLLRAFCRENGYRRCRRLGPTEGKEFTYWLFKYRVSRLEKARVASDTRKALDCLRAGWARGETSGLLFVEGIPDSAGTC